jgi:pyridinium-3,5-biscarboxylic acid mononucleotide sulfurtransferase
MKGDVTKMNNTKYARLKELLAEMEKVVVAFSGGVDSTFLLKAALDSLGAENVLAVTADSETYPSKELAEAKRIASQLGIRHEVIETSELGIPGYAENSKNRCYFCKQSLFEHLIPIMESNGYKNIIFGLIADDMSEYRPGAKAAKEMGVRGPLQEVGLYKSEIRELSNEMDLPTWDKPSLACLSSRIAYGEMITLEKLKKIDKAEIYLKSFGIRQVRVRTHDDIARIEVEQKDMEKVMQNHELINRELQSYGYTYVTLDLMGYKSGSMNKTIS